MKKDDTIAVDNWPATWGEEDHPGRRDRARSTPKSGAGCKTLHVALSQTSQHKERSMCLQRVSTRTMPYDALESRERRQSMTAFPGCKVASPYRYDHSWLENGLFRHCDLWDTACTYTHLQRVPFGWIGCIPFLKSSVPAYRDKIPTRMCVHWGFMFVNKLGETKSRRKRYEAQHGQQPKWPWCATGVLGQFSITRFIFFSSWMVVLPRHVLRGFLTCQLETAFQNRDKGTHSESKKSVTLYGCVEIAAELFDWVIGWIMDEKCVIFIRLVWNHLAYSDNDNMVK